MRFLFLLRDNVEQTAAMGRAERRRIYQAHMDLAARLVADGRLIANEALQGNEAATTVRREPDLVTDGPYAETKEELGAFYLVECADLDQALALAREFPYSPGMTVEIHPTA